MNTDFLKAEFEGKFGTGEEPQVFFAPGRVNLIGEHTDYNGGCVLPCALSIGTYAAVRKRQDGRLLMYSMNFPEDGIIEADVGVSMPDGRYGWALYVLGMIDAFLRLPGIECAYPLESLAGQRTQKFDITGFEMCVYGNIPNGSGLSSSASLEVLVGYIIKELFGIEISNRDIAILGMYAENNFCGVSCGIMDQFAIAMGKKDHAIFLDTNSLSFEYTPIRLEGIRIVISCTNKVRKLGESQYNNRRRECERAREILCGHKKIDSLAQLSMAEFEEAGKLIDDEVILKRARHAISESARTVEAVKLLRDGDIEGFGRLMNESHRSLKEDYEVTGSELDTIVSAAQAQRGVLGSRMTGAGFGGCSVSLVLEKDVDDFISNVGREYRKNIGYDADFFVVDVGDGPRRN